MASGAWDRLLTFLGFEEEIVGDDDEAFFAEDEEEQVALATVGEAGGRRARRVREAAPQDEQPRRYGSLVPLAGGRAKSSASMRVVVWHPVAFDEIQGLVDRLREGAQIVVNLEDVDRSLSGRIINFLSGSIYALGGSMYRVSTQVMIFVPAGGTVEPAGGLADGWSDDETER